jgi:tyrosyl-tRNA synthetase
MQHGMESSFDLLVERGFVHQTSNEAALREALRRPITLYCGYDATATSLHIGNLLQIMLLAHLQRAGHRPIGVIGGGTTMVGDPSGKTEARPLLSREQIRSNQEGIRRQVGHYLDFSEGRALMVDNADWLLELGYVDFLREIGRHFSVNQLLQHETYRERLQGSGLSFIELNYALLQAYDFLHLYREHGCRLQIGGSDQWFNILAGTELIRRVEGGEAFALVTPLIATASGAKMGKTETGAVWLDSDRTSPYEFYQYWVNTEDPDVGRFLRLFTFLPEEEIRRLEALEGAELRAAKETLAFEVTRLRDGEAAARKAQASARALFGGAEGSLDAVPTTAIPAERLARGVEVVDLLQTCGLAPSKAAARRLIEQGGAYLGDRRVESPDQRVVREDLGADGLLLRAGKKRYHRLVATP